MNATTLQWSLPSTKSPPGTATSCASYTPSFSSVHSIGCPFLRAILLELTLNSSADALSRNQLPLFLSLNPQASPHPNSVPADLCSLLFERALRWTSPQVDRAIQFYLNECVAPSTCASYASACCRFVSFCQAAAARDPFPVTEDSICHFAAYLGQQNLKHHSIKCSLGYSLQAD